MHGARRIWGGGLLAKCSSAREFFFSFYNSNGNCERKINEQIFLLYGICAVRIYCPGYMFTPFICQTMYLALVLYVMYFLIFFLLMFSIFLFFFKYFPENVVLCCFLTLCIFVLQCNMFVYLSSFFVAWYLVHRCFEFSFCLKIKSNYKLVEFIIMLFIRLIYGKYFCFCLFAFLDLFK